MSSSTGMLLLILLALHGAGGRDRPLFQGDYGPNGNPMRALVGPECWYPNYYCSVTSGNTQTPIVVTGGPGTCYNKCNGDGTCNFFTWFKRRGVEYCYLLTECGKDYQIEDDWCTVRQSCYSGPSDCSTVSNNNTMCAKLEASSDDLLEWQCENGGTGQTVNAYNGTLNTGTRCMLSCPSWQSFRWAGKSTLTYPYNNKAYLFSTCQADGSWSEVLPNDFKDEATVLEWPTLANLELPTYPTPDVGSVSCGCRDLVLVWPPQNESLGSDNSRFFYNPRDEPGASMECEDEVQNSEVTAMKEFRVDGENTCRFLCDDFLVATVTCSDGMWTGDTQQGFWCYEHPKEENKLKGGCNCGLAKRQESRMIGGQATEDGEYPWNVIVKGLGTDGTGYCGGALISDQWVLTTVICAGGSYDGGSYIQLGNQVQVFLGDPYSVQDLINEEIFDVESDFDGLLVNVTDILLHPEASPIGGDYIDFDFALLKLANPIDFNTEPNIRPVCLPEEGDSEDFSNFKAVASGMGMNGNVTEFYDYDGPFDYFSFFPNGTYEVELEVMNKAKCENAFWDSWGLQFTPRMACVNVTADGGKGACLLDGGSPLVTSMGGDGVTPGQNYRLIGVLMDYDGGNCGSYDPDLYSNVASVLNWIRTSTSASWNTCPAT